MAAGRLAIPFITALLVAGPTWASRPEPDGAARLETLTGSALDQVRMKMDPSSAEKSLLQRRGELRLNDSHGFQHQFSQVDHFGRTYHHFRQTYLGLAVYGAEIVLQKHQDGHEEIQADTLARNFDLDIHPSLGLSEIRATAVRTFQPYHPNHVPGKIELVVWPITQTVLKASAPERPYGPNAEDFDTQVVGHRLAYFVRNTELSRPDGPKQTVHIFDAHTGEVIAEWNDLHTDQASKGTGKSQYNGTVTLDTNKNASGKYELRDLTRGTLAHPWTKVIGNQTNNLNNAGKMDPTGATLYTEDPGLGTLYSDADNTWGDGTNYVEGSDTNAAQGQTAAADTHYGVAMTWDFYKNVLGRTGIDGLGTSALNRVHFGHGDTISEANAFWIGYDSSDSQACFCMTYGDGANDPTYNVNMKSVTALDVSGHELSHGVCETTAGLGYTHEAGGLNEANSDIFGTMVEFYARGAAGQGATVPDTGGNWLIGDEVNVSGSPLRWMYKPSKDGHSFDYWTSAFATSTSTAYDPHYTSGPMNRCFYFLSCGSSATTTSDYYSKYLTSGMTGLGNQKAAQIWYHALLKLTTNATFLNARNAAIQAAKDIYGAGGAEEAAVWNAFAGINVGSAWTTTQVNVVVSPATVTLNTGTTQTFTTSVTGTTNLAVTWSVVETGGGSITSGGVYTAPSAIGTYHVKATSAADTTKFGQATITVVSGINTITPSIISPAAGAAATVGTPVSFSGSATDSSSTATLSYSWNFGDQATATGATASHTYATAGTYTITFTATDNTGATKSITRTITVNPISNTYNEVESNGTTSTANVVADSVTKIVGTIGTTTDLDFFKINVGAGRTVTVNMTGPSGKDYDLYLLNSAGTTLKSSLGTTATESVTYTNTATTSQVFYIKVLGYNKAYSTTPYNLAITR